MSVNSSTRRYSVGTYLEEREESPAYTKIHYEYSELEMLSYFDVFWQTIENRFSGEYHFESDDDEFASANQSTNARCSVTDGMLYEHSTYFGGSNKGKTRLMLHLMRQQLQAGHSLVAFDPDALTIAHLASICSKILPPQDVTLISLSEDFNRLPMPGWNPLDWKLRGMSISTIATEMRDLMENVRESEPWSTRMTQFTDHALMLASAHRLTLIEAQAVLQVDGYADALIARQPEAAFFALEENKEAWEQVTQYFKTTWRRFVDRFGNIKHEDVDPTVSRFRPFTEAGKLRTLLCPTASTLRFADLWGNRSKVLLVHLDTTAGGEGTKILAALLFRQLFSTGQRLSIRADDRRHVVVSVDEVGELQKTLKEVRDGMSTMLARARKLNIRIMAATQGAYQLPSAMASALQQLHTRAYFSLSPEDASALARFVQLPEEAASGTAIARFVIGRGPKTQSRTFRYQVVDDESRPFNLSHLIWSPLKAMIAQAPDDVYTALKINLRLLTVGSSLFIEESGELIDLYYFHEAGWEIRLAANNPLRIDLVMPGFSITPMRNENRTSTGSTSRSVLQSMTNVPSGTALVVTPERTGFVKIDHVENPPVFESVLPFLTQCMQYNGQPPSQTVGDYSRRMTAIHQVAQAAALPPEPPRPQAPISARGPKPVIKAPPQNKRDLPAPSWSDDE